jgi:hypothetical protein
MDLTKEFKVIGKWWLPDNESNYCFGEFSYTFSKGLQLLVFGSFIGTSNIYQAKNNFILEVIRGITKDGKCITLMKAFGHEVGSNQLLQSKFTIETAAISSTHFMTPETDRFDLISINLNCSEAFFSSLYNRLAIDSFDQEGDITQLKYKKSEPKEIYKDENLNAYLFFNYSFHFAHGKPNEFEFAQSVLLNSEFPNSLLFTDTIQYGQNIKTLFTFFSTIKIFYRKLSIREKETRVNFDLLLNQGNKINIEKVDFSELLINYKELQGQFQHVFRWWINNYEYVSYGLSLYQQLIYSTNLVPTQSFLNIVFALETLHSTFFNKKNFSQEDYARFKSQKENFEMDEIFQKRFNECLASFNELSFKSRIKDLFERNRPLLSSYIDSIEDFSTKVKNQRNYLAHQHAKSRDNLIPLQNLEYYVFMCKLLFDVNFLCLIGLNQQNIELILKRDFLLNYYKERKP